MRFHRYNPQASPTLRLFCFPYGGGGLASYSAWPAAVPKGVEVASPQLPGRDSLVGVEPVVDLPTLVDLVATGIRPLLDRPFVMFGHSLGALLAFEATRLLRRQGGPLPRLLMVSARSAPHLPPTRPAIHHLPRESFLEEFRRYGGMPADGRVSEELVELLLPALRADMRMHEEYDFAEETPLDVPLAAFGGRDDPEVDREELMAWSEHTTAGFLLRLFPGRHFYTGESRGELLATISGLLGNLLH